MNRFKLIIGMAALFVLAATATTNAQSANVEDVIMTFSDSDRDLAELKDKIDAASVHAKTGAKAKTFYWKGKTYLAIANDSAMNAMYPNATETALEALNKALSLDTKKRYTEDTEREMLNVAVGLYNKAYNAYSAGDYSNAHKTFSSVTPLLKYDYNEDLKRAKLTEESINKMLAYCALGEKDNAKALTSFKKIIADGSSDPLMFIQAARIELEEGDTTAALSTIAAGREMDESNRDLINQELDIYLKQGRSEELIDKLNVAIEEDPGNTIYYFARAISYEGMGNLEKAGADYDKILEIDPDYHDASYNKGVMYLNQVAVLVDEMNAKNLYKQSDIDPYDAKIKALYEKGIVHFERVFENNEEMAMEDKLELAKTMRKIYAQLGQMDKFARMKDFISAN